ncbi:C-type lectin 37Da-like [Calliphora vicina]|uniref:C-type lectin 37Da-like n=1 Tax=Calliphora vicina TaxID=7373 RepID=UPI00325C04CE
MWQSIFKICFAFSLTSVALSYYSPRINTKSVDEFPSDMSTAPFIKLGQKYYHFGHKEVNWYKAFLVCRTLGGALASFETEEEWKLLSDHLLTLGDKRYWWVSAADFETENEFYWYRTGEPVSYAKWSDNQPDNFEGNEDCVFMWYENKQYEMNDFDCYDVANYVCECKPPSSIVVVAY